MKFLPLAVLATTVQAAAAQVVRLPLDSLPIVARIPVPSVPAGVPTPWGDIATGAGAVWVSVSGTPVTRIDSATHAVTHQFVGGSGADAIRYGFASLWVSDHEHGEVWRIDPSRIVVPGGGRR